MMKRREFITLLSSAAAAWPLAASAQQRGRVRRIGALMALAADDPDAQVRVAAFAQGLQELGWTVRENVRIDYRWAPSEADRIRYAAELVALMPDVILATSGATVGALQHASRTVPIVFVTTIDPVGAAGSPAWRDRAGTPPALPHLNSASAENGWNCSKKLRPA